MNIQTFGRFTDCELEIATAVAGWRAKRVMREGLGRGHGEAKGRGFGRDLPGALGELAFAKLHRMYWAGSPEDFGREGDVAQFEVRTTTHNEGHLIVFPGDPDERCVVLVVVRFPAYRVAGCINAGEAKQDRYLPPKGSLRPGSQGQWWVPQSDLRTI